MITSIESNLESQPLLGNETESQKTRSCFSFFREDLKLSLFSIQEPSGEIIDIQASFAPKPTWSTVLIRTIFFVFSFGSAAYSFIDSNEKWIWFGYLTHWAAIYTFLYQLPILICSIQASLIPQPKPGDQPNFLTRFLWVMYSVATVTEIAITLLYWVLVYDQSSKIEFVDVALHGVFAVLLLIDGVIVGKIPVRLKHIVFLEMTALAYLVWSLIHSLADVGVSRDINNGDPLYDALNWQEAPLFASIVTLVTLFILLPSFFLLVWVLSLYAPVCKCYGSSRRVLVPVV